jgi:hypothetical protein
MILAPLAAALLSQLPQTSFSRQSRSFFEGLIDIRIEKKQLAIKAPNGLPDVSGLMALARTAFPDASQVTVRSANGSSFSGGGDGGGGNVAIQIGLPGSSQGFEFQLASSAGDESVTLRQGNAEELLIELRTRKASLRFEQERGKCKVVVKAGADSFSATRASLLEVLSSPPPGRAKYLLGFLELYLDKTPVVAFSGAPPGKTIVRLKDGAEIYGELQVAELKLTTAYGQLTIPRSELIQITFTFPEGSGRTATEEADKAAASAPDQTMVTGRRYSPVGRLEATSFIFRTPYGDLLLQAADIVQMDFGPPEPEAEAAGVKPAAARGQP